MSTAPSDLYLFKPDRNTFCISWRNNPADTDTLSNFEFEIQSDSVSTFDSINLKSYYTTDTSLNYQRGNFFHGLILNDISSLTDFTLYFRVRIVGTYSSSWSDYDTWTTAKVTWYADTNLAMGLLSDGNVYSKEGVTNAKKIIEMYMRELQEFKKESALIKRYAGFQNAQDTDLYNLMGDLLQYNRDDSSTFTEYRRELIELWNCYLEGGTQTAIKRFIKALMGVDPVIQLHKNRFGWIVHASQRNPFVVPQPVPANPYTDPTNHYFTKDSSATEFNTSIPRPQKRMLKGLGFTLLVYNPFNLTTKSNLIVAIVNKLKPINTTVYIEYFKFITGFSYWGGVGYWGDGYWWGDNTAGYVQYYPVD